MELRYDSKNDSRSELRLQLKMRMTFVIPTSTQLERSVSSQYYRTMYSPNHSSDSYDGCIENISSEQTTSTIRESLRGQEPSVMYKLYQVPGTCTPDSYGWFHPRPACHSNTYILYSKNLVDAKILGSIASIS